MSSMMSMSEHEDLYLGSLLTLFYIVGHWFHDCDFMGEVLVFLALMEVERFSHFELFGQLLWVWVFTTILLFHLFYTFNQSYQHILGRTCQIENLFVILVHFQDSLFLLENVIRVNCITKTSVNISFPWLANTLCFLRVLIKLHPENWIFLYIDTYYWFISWWYTDHIYTI